MGLHSQLIDRAGNTVHRTVDGLNGLWVAHRWLLQHNPAYEAALASSAAAMITQISWERFIAALVAGVLDIYTAIRRRTTSWSAAPAFEDGWESA